MNSTKTPVPQPPSKLAASTAILAALFGIITLSGLVLALKVQNQAPEPGAKEPTQADLNATTQTSPANAAPEAASPETSGKNPKPGLDKAEAATDLKPTAMTPAALSAPTKLVKVVHPLETQAPVPVKTVTPPYPPLGKAAKVQGEVNVVLEVDARGVPVKATVRNGPVLLRASALEAAKDWRFRPAYRGAVAVPSEFVATFQFHI